MRLGADRDDLHDGGPYPLSHPAARTLNSIQ